MRRSFSVCAATASILIVILAAATDAAKTHYGAKNKSKNERYKNENRLVGTWNCVDVVEKSKDFEPEVRQWTEGPLPMKKLVFFEKGGMSPGHLRWYGKYIKNERNDTKYLYSFKKIKGDMYIFLLIKGDKKSRFKENVYIVFKKKDENN